MQLFFTPDCDDDLCQLSPDESRHCIRVLRLAAGDTLWLTDGKGTLCKATIAQPDDKNCLVQIVERIPNYQQRPYRLHIAVAPTKNNARLEWFLEKAVEIGIDEITPIVCDHSERANLNADRLDKIIVSAMKQSLKAYKPLLHAATPLRQQLAQPFEGQKMICYCNDELRIPLRQVCQPGSSSLILIGPEGDFSAEEVQLALQQGFKPVTLGNCRLRTETAALYAAAAVSFLNT